MITKVSQFPYPFIMLLHISIYSPLEESVTVYIAGSACCAAELFSPLN